MSYLEFIGNGPLLEAALAFTEASGGRFVCEEPGDQLVYITEDGTPHTPPEGITPEQMLQVLQSGDPADWPELEYEPGQDY